jgi:protein-S-isoprenylcysteine O-methyltransferase Ste14
MSPFLAISILWVIFEIFLSRKKRSSKESKMEDGSSLRVLWITLILSIILGIYLSQINIGTINIDSLIIHYIGLFLIIIGLIIRWFAILKLKEFFTVAISIHKDHKVVDTGIYKYIRHPAYLGSLLSFLGLGLAFQNWLTIIVIFFPIFGALSYRIHIEEKVLNREFGEEYSEYSSRTHKLIPWIY